jgi:phage FluMu protein Com
MFEYEVEGGVDFFNELKQMSAPAAATAASTAPPRCLITDEPLRRDHITLQCGHKFNYIPLFKDVLFQKCSLLPKNLSSSIITMYTKDAPSASVSSTSMSAQALPTSHAQNSSVLSVMYNSSYNLETTKLQYNEMKCPYCRTITPHILPYYPYPEVSKVKYVNIPPNMSLPTVSCEYDKYITGTHTAFATNEPTPSCKSSCVYNEKYDVMLCNKHLNKLETQAATTIKPKPKPKSNTIDDENVIVSHHNPATSVCSFVLLSGARKGAPCGKPMWMPKTATMPMDAGGGQQAFCKAHYARGVPPPNGGSYVL